MNTGFGGSADSRTKQSEALQRALLQHHHFGVLTQADKGSVALNGDALPTHAMPSAWVRGTILIRCNSVAHGHSAVSLNAITTLIALLQNNAIPVIPLRGSISASGDLSPLAYIAGAITGNPDIRIRMASGIVSAAEALKQLGIEPITLGPKEGLGLMNGTASSVAVASLALYETHQLAVFSQILSAMTLEALLGSAGNYDPFIAKVRPHRGQIESSRNILRFLHGSQLASGLPYRGAFKPSATNLYQDRYALRTASQWIGPQLEDLLLAHEQILTEQNSTTDNPLIDVPGETTHHGGNFQAASTTSAMEKTRLSLQMIGKMLFAQCSELINPMLNNGLPPNLAADEPSVSFTMKGVDIGMASYMSELAFLANPVSSHVQSAEMHNQAINSLALISGRYTLQAVELTSLMSASHLYTVCQALDLRVMQMTFLQALEAALQPIGIKVFSAILAPSETNELHAKVWTHMRQTWLNTTILDSQDRIERVIKSSLAVLTDFLLTLKLDSSSPAFAAMGTWKSLARSAMAESFTVTRSRFFQRQNTPDFLGLAAKKLYLFVRHNLEVPFHLGLEDHPTPTNKFCEDARKKQTIGSWIGVIYESLRDGRLHEPLMEILAETGAMESTNLEKGDVSPTLEARPSKNRKARDGVYTSEAHHTSSNGVKA